MKTLVCKHRFKREVTRFVIHLLQAIKVSSSGDLQSVYLIVAHNLCIVITVDRSVQIDIPFGQLMFGLSSDAHALSFDYDLCLVRYYSAGKVVLQLCIRLRRLVWFLIAVIVHFRDDEAHLGIRRRISDQILRNPVKIEYVLSLICFPIACMFNLDCQIV